MNLENALGQLPAPILDKLEAMIRRVRRLLLIRGLFATLAVALACLLAIMAIDAVFTLFSSTARWVLSLTGLVITLIAAWWFLVRPLSRKLTLTHMARILELRHPELQERISTAVELMTSEDPDSIRGSEELITAVVDSAVIDVEAVDPKSEFKPMRAARFMSIAGAAAAIVLLLLAIWPQQSWTLLSRALAPFLNIGNAWADSLVIDPGDLRIATGDTVTIDMSVNHKRLKRAEIRRLLPDGTESVERMSLVSEAEDGAKKFTVTFPNVSEDFEYRIRAGSAVSEFFSVETVDPPAVEDLRIAYDYPAYTQLPNSESSSETGEIRAVAYTEVIVKATANKTGTAPKLILNEGNEIPSPTITDNEIAWSFRLNPGMKGTWRIELTDDEGFANDPVNYPIDALPDKAPTVQITRPVEREMRLKPTERLPLGLELIEDFGFDSVDIIATPDGATVPQAIVQSLPRESDRPRIYLANLTLDLAALDLRPEQRRIAVQIRAADSRPTDYDGPGVGYSETIYITLDEKAQSLADQAIQQHKRDVDEQIRETKRELERARDEMRRAEQELNRSEEISDPARDRLEQFTERADSAKEKLEDLAEKLDETLFQEQSDMATSIAEEQVETAREKSEMIPLTDSKQERTAEARESREAIEQAIREVDKLAQSMRKADDDYRAIAKLNDLANRQQEVASAAQEWAKKSQERAEQLAQSQDENAQKQFDQEQRKEQSRFESRQNQVEQQLGQMLKDNASALAEVLEQQREEATQLAEATAALAAEQQALREINQEALSATENKQDALRQELLDRLQSEQTALAQEAKAQNQPEAAAEASEAAAALGEKNLEAASESANEASESLAGSDAAESLAEKQAELAEQIESVKNGDLQAALSEMESNLQEEAQSLQSQSQDMEQTMQNLQQNTAKAQSDQAERALQQGAQKADTAARQLDQAQKQQSQAQEKREVAEGELSQQARPTMGRARAEQQQSQNFLEQAARALAQSSESIGQTLEGMEKSDMDDRLTNSEALAEGFDDVSDASESEGAQEASESSQQAADSLQKLAQQAMQKLGSPPPGQPQPGQPPTDQPQDPQSETMNETGEKAADASGDIVPPELSQLGISAEDWAQFKGALSGGNASEIETKLPAEYRELVGRYFQVIAKEASE